MMCRVLDVSRAGFYAWRNRRPSKRSCRDTEILSRMEAVHSSSRETYGRRRLHAALRNDGIGISGKRVRRLMRVGGIIVRTRRRYKVTTDSKHDLPIAENVLIVASGLMILPRAIAAGPAI